ncbi:hypothetical protein HZA86_01175 [Candidatus Uhrbacteria bacterium]|nr:hypothetical protein [Candidatus Uhrbacteria bacterium]
MDQQLEEYFHQARQSGMSDQEIARALHEAGWEESAIQQSLQEKASNDKDTTNAALTGGKKRKWRVIGLIIGGFVLFSWAVSLILSTLSACKALAPLSGFFYGGGTEVKRIECIINRAIEKQDADLCQRISHAEIKEQCFSSSITEAGTDEKNYDKKLFSSGEPINIETCKTQIPSAIKYICIQAVADQQQSVEYCNLLPTIPLKDECLFGIIAMEKQDPNSCALIQKETTRNSCYRTIARKKGAPDLCNDISSQAGKDNCYYGIALDQHAFQICALIQPETKTLRQDKTLRDDCFEKVEKTN